MMRATMILCVLLPLAILGLSVQGVAPLCGRLTLTTEQEQQLKKLEGAVARAEYAGRFEVALRQTLEEVGLLKQWLGEKHWRAVNATMTAEDLRWLAKLTPEQQKKAAEMTRFRREARVAFQKGQFADAEASFRKALTLSKKSLGEEHPETATNLNNLAACLRELGRTEETLPLYQQALAIRKKTFGEEHSRTATVRANLAMCLDAHGMTSEALPHLEKALAIHRKTLGEEHPLTANDYANLASLHRVQGHANRALPFAEKSLVIRLAILGEEHRDTADSYNGIALCLRALAKATQAIPIYEKSLALRRKLLGENHPTIAQSYLNLALCLNNVGKADQALPLFEKALAIRKKTLGEDHPGTARSYAHLASCVKVQGKTAQALVLYEKAMAIRQKVHGPGHPDLARSYRDLANCLSAQGKPALAQPLYEKALAIFVKVHGHEHPETLQISEYLASCFKAQERTGAATSLCEENLTRWKKLLGEEHFNTASSYCALADAWGLENKWEQALPLYEKALVIQTRTLGAEHPATVTSANNLACCFHRLGQFEKALKFAEKSLAIRRKTLGEHHPHTATSYHNVAMGFHSLGKDADAIRTFEAGLPSYDLRRLLAAPTGFDAAQFRADGLSPREALALTLARHKKPVEAWNRLEEHLARGLLEDLGNIRTQKDDETAAALQELDERLVPLLGIGQLREEQQIARDELLEQRTKLIERSIQGVRERSAGTVWPLERIQKHIRADEALVVWIRGFGKCFACVLRQNGEPNWVAVPGTGSMGTWTIEDKNFPARLHEALASSATAEASQQRLREEVAKLWLAPVKAAFQATKTLPAVRRLVVVPVGDLSSVPLEALTEDYTVSYTPSATVFARLRTTQRAVDATSILALGEPAFPVTKKLESPPSAGLLVTRVHPGGNADLAGVQLGDILIQYNTTPLSKIDDVRNAVKSDKAGILICWRVGERKTFRVSAGSLGVDVDTRALAVALKSWAEKSTFLRSIEHYEPLPGSRHEVETIARLAGKVRTTVLLGKDASDHALDDLAVSGKLKSFRVIHLATHGKANRVVPEESFVVLSRGVQDRAREISQASKGQPLFDGRLRVRDVRERWTLDADLVTLSACESGLGTKTTADGLLGFSQALLEKGARSVVLSRWKVDDTATALFMVRFYENLLGKGAARKALPQAEALREARTWLRGLSRKDAEALGGALLSGKLSDTSRGSIVVLKPGEKKVTLPRGEKPFANPYYWSAFVLVGDSGS